MAPRFEVLVRDGRARRGRLTTPHGAIETPAFMPVGTLGAVKGLAPGALEELGAEVLLANLYHLALRPGLETIEQLGGLHAFTGWRRPLLTDSGGFQIWSLAGLRELDEGGVTFRSHLDGASLRFTPEWVVEAQERLGVDLAMVLDECLPWPCDEPTAERALGRTLVWAERSLAARRAPERTALFGIAQGGVHRPLRERAARRLGELPFDGFAIGGVAVGEPEAERKAVVEWTAPLLPEDRPRYLMGVGTPADLLHAVAQGVDLFDCVLPARNGRHGLLFTRSGLLRIKNARYRNDPLPVDPDCLCPTCARLSRAFLHHLVRAGEITAAVLATVHNIRFFLDFMGEIRKAIGSCRLEELARDRAVLQADDNRSENPAAQPL
ncbi:MAG TPA: tRNA guanosine(34) transglycosylase Tgt [Thermoanaerobaculia bacterium]|nr:tRNA guanosine(34) transglycosylase Tgt [Thermoanaerobaculia bacterium]